MLAGRRTYRSLPPTMRAGLALVALGAAIDIGYHVITDSAGTGHGPVAFTGHIVTLAGMVLTMLGLFGAALARRPVKTSPLPKGENK